MLISKGDFNARIGNIKIEKNIGRYEENTHKQKWNEINRFCSLQQTENYSHIYTWTARAQ